MTLIPRIPKTLGAAAVLALAGSAPAAIVADWTFDHLGRPNTDGTGGSASTTAYPFPEGGQPADATPVEDESGNRYHGWYGGLSSNTPLVTYDTPSGTAGLDCSTVGGYLIVRENMERYPGGSHPDGDGANFDHGYAPTPSTLPPLAADGGSGTIEALINFDVADASPEAIFGNPDNAAGQWWVRSYGGTDSSSGIRVLLRGATGGQVANYFNTPAVNDTAWHHLAVVVDRALNELRVYVDSEQVTTIDGVEGAGAVDISGLSGAIGAPAFDIHLGYVNNDDFNGQLDRVVMSDEALGPGRFVLEARAAGPVLTVATSDSDLEFTWNSQDGKVYDLLSATTLDTPPSTPWPAYDNGVDPAYENIAADPSGANTLTVPRPADSVRFFAVLEKAPPPPPPLFADDFEGADPGWVAGGSPGDSPGTTWERGAPGAPGPDAAFGGTGCAGTNLDALYTANAAATFTSPPIAIPFGGATLRFQQWIDTEGSPSGDFGTINLLDADDGDAQLAVLADGIEGLGTDGWTPQSFALPVSAWEKNVKLQFVFTSDGDTETWAGWYVDDLEVVLAEPVMDMQELYGSDRFPNVVTATNGAVLAFWNGVTVRRSEDGGATWGPEILVGTGYMGGGVTVDETSGDILAFVETEHPPAPLTVYRSTDHGLTWQAQTTTINPDVNGNVPSMSMAEHGITLLHGSHPGRLLRPARWYDDGNGEEFYPEHYNTAIYSDDGGYTWNTSDPFPANGTGEGTVAERSDGTVYYNSRRHWAPEGVNARQRWTAESLDDGETWTNLAMSEVLPDGDQIRDYGLMGGLTRLPIEGRDLFVFSNIESPSGRTNGTVWVSFDGGLTWPLKRLVYGGSFAYSSLDAGRPGTAGDGWIYLFFEGGPSGAGTMARFNLPWLLGGQLTGDGDLPDWLP